MTAQRLGMILLLAGLLLAQPASARICFFWGDGVSSMAFGTYQPGQPSPLDSTANITVLCVGNASAGQSDSVYVRIDGGGSANVNNRQLQGTPSGQLDYNIYQDFARMQVWGDGSGAPALEDTITTYIALQFYTAYGSIPASQDPIPGTYSDNVNVTIGFTP